MHCNLFIALSFFLVERRSLIDAAIQEAKYHAEVQNDVSDNAVKSLLAFKESVTSNLEARPSEAAL